MNPYWCDNQVGVITGKGHRCDSLGVIARKGLSYLRRITHKQHRSEIIAQTITISTHDRPCILIQLMEAQEQMEQRK